MFFAIAMLFACSVQPPDPDTMLENTPVYSANGRFYAVPRWIERLPDFTSGRAGTLLGLDTLPPIETEDSERTFTPLRTTVTTALYESKDTRRLLLAEIPIAIEQLGTVLVADSGRYVAAVRTPGHGSCNDYPYASTPLVTIYRSNGTLMRAITVGDVASEYDVMQLQRADPLTFVLRPESDTREVIVIKAGAQERRIDIATGELLDDKRDLFARPHAYVTAVSSERKLGDPFASDVVRIDSAKLLAQAIDAPLPDYPMVAMKARISGVVHVRFLVSEKGQVVAVENSPLPFGIDAATVAAAQRWSFRPMLIDGNRVKFTGEVAFHFENPLTVVMSTP